MWCNLALHWVFQYGKFDQDVPPIKKFSQNLKSTLLRCNLALHWVFRFGKFDQGVPPKEIHMVAQTKIVFPVISQTKLLFFAKCFRLFPGRSVRMTNVTARPVRMLV